MKEFKQSKWSEPTIFEMGSPGRRGCNLPVLNEKIKTILVEQNYVPEHLRRKADPDLPELSEVEVVRHFTRLSQMNFGVDSGFYPLGSCTMKYNPKMNDALASSDKAHWIHPYQPEDTMQGTLELMYKLASWLAEITGTSKVSLQPAAGAHGELVGTLLIRAYHKFRGELDKRDEIVVPDSAHGTNPASASMAGFKVVIVPTGADGCVDIEALKAAVSSRTAGLMLTNPNTLGIFENKTLEIANIIHEAGGLLYYDGANLNAILGKTKPGIMGFDIVHVNLHKTFSTPHGGGGPGAGPVGVKEHLTDFLPVPLVEFDGKGRYFLNYNVPHTIGKVKAFYGNFEVLVRAFAYILIMGSEGLEKISEMAVLNANYLASKLSKIKGFDMPYGKDKPRKHEFVLSCSRLKSETGVSAKNVAKRLLDYGFHAPTVYFPSIIDEALMIEPTETEPIETLDKFVEIMNQISNEAYTNPETVLEAPHNTSVGLVDEVKASHPKTMCLSWRMYKKHHAKTASSVS
ncbi:MAG: aminomethyl-transferring glycine dehydrogenase subunit GcvPB [Candidatus Bathyarchaeia archaeon]